MLPNDRVVVNQLINASQRTASRLANHVIFMSGCHQLVTTSWCSKNGHSRLALCCHCISVLQEWLLKTRVVLTFASIGVVPIELSMFFFFAAFLSKSSLRTRFSLGIMC